MTWDGEDQDWLAGKTPMLAASPVDTQPYQGVQSPPPPPNKAPLSTLAHLAVVRPDQLPPADPGDPEEHRLAWMIARASLPPTGSWATGRPLPTHGHPWQLTWIVMVAATIGVAVLLAVSAHYFRQSFTRALEPRSRVSIVVPVDRWASSGLDTVGPAASAFSIG